MKAIGSLPFVRELGEILLAARCARDADVCVPTAVFTELLHLIAAGFREVALRAPSTLALLTRPQGVESCLQVTLFLLPVIHPNGSGLCQDLVANSSSQRLSCTNRPHAPLWPSEWRPNLTLPTHPPFPCALTKRTQQRGGAPPAVPDKYSALREMTRNMQGRLAGAVAKLQGKDTQMYSEMNSCPPKPLQVMHRVCVCVG